MMKRKTMKMIMMKKNYSMQKMKNLMIWLDHTNDWRVLFWIISAVLPRLFK
jgi:hypothetical protein